MKAADIPADSTGHPAPGPGQAPLGVAEAPGVRAFLQLFSPLELGALGLTITVAAVLRFHALAVKSFWFDEGLSVIIARLGWYDFARILWRREGNMSLYYLLLRAWLHLGNSEFFVRSLSVAFALATVPALYLLGRRLFGRRAGLIAVTLLAVNAYDVRYSQDARSYTLMAFLCVLSSLYFLKCLDNPSRRNRIAYVLLSTLAVYAHFYAGLLVVAHWLSLCLLDSAAAGDIKRCLRWWALAVLPVAVFVATTGAGPLRWIQRPGLRDWWEFGLRLTGKGGPWLLLAYGVACLGALFSVSASPNRRVLWTDWRLRFLVLWLLFPPLFITAVSMARPLFLPRYFFFCLPALVLLAAAGLSRLRSIWLLGPAWLLFLLLSLQGTFSYYQQDIDLQRDNWRAASAYILANARPGDALIFHIAMARMPFEYYRSLSPPPSGAPAVLYPRHGDHISYLDFTDKPDRRQLEGALPQHQRLWLVLSNARDSSGPDQIALSLENLAGAAYSGKEAHNFPGVEVLLFHRENPDH